MSGSNRQNSIQRAVWLPLAAVSIVVFSSAYLIWKWPHHRLYRAEVAANEGKHGEAEEIAQGILDWWPEWPPALSAAANAAVAQQQYARAVDYWDRMADDAQMASACRTAAAVTAFEDLHRLTDAERRLREILDRHPDDVLAHRSLAFLMDVCGRSWEAIPIRLFLLRQGDRSLQNLRMLIERDLPASNVEFVGKCLQDSPDDSLTRLSVAVVQLRAGRSDQAETSLQEIVTTAPDIVEAQVRLGRVLWESGNTAELQRWINQLPASAEQHPEIWALRGDLARNQADLRGAIRCYWESLLRDACYQRSAYQLGQALIAIGDTERAEPFVERAARLQQLAEAAQQYASSPNAASIEEIADLCEWLGLRWEDRAWSQLALDTNPQLAWAQEHLKRLNPLLVPDLPRTAPDANPALTIKLSDYPMPVWAAAARTVTPSPDQVQGGGNIRFTDGAAAADLDFSYFNDENPDTPASRPFEFTGGGVAVLDYDGDGWPDIYLTQGCVWPPHAGQREHLDRLFRNLGNGKFRDVTIEAGLVEDSYSQGVTVGDYNADGYPDLYVANLDANRLFRNNGDGTFCDLTIESSTGGDDWTTSCLMADLNGDAFPEVYAVNYLAGSDVFERICRTSQGQPRICTPNDFEAAQDQLYLNLGDGRFEEWTTEGGVQLPHGKGLGIVAFDGDGSGGLNLFVANDTDSNSYFINETSAPGELPLFREAAIGSGLACDQNGLPQACMGVAVGDADADGLIDLFVTNYYQEANTLYLQQPGNLFRDATQEAGLFQSSLPMLGFGTQFLDGDLDGDLDLVAVNGHVEDLRDRGVPYQMRPQLFQNMGAGRFVELAPESLGAFFQNPALGRGLARLDWNRDGLEDVVVSHLDTPVALLTNRSTDVGHFFAIRLRGVESSRDAIGAMVHLTAGELTSVQQLTAGDGYLTSNERKLTFGLGSREEVDEVTVHWPSGQVQTFASPPIDSTLLAVEGRASLLPEPAP